MFAKKTLTTIGQGITGIFFTALALFLAGPGTSHAAVCNISANGDFSDFLLFPACLINEYLIPIAIGLEVVLFTYGIISYIAKADNAEERKQGSKYIMWGIIAIFITLSFWAVVGILQRTLQLA